MLPCQRPTTLAPASSRYERILTTLLHSHILTTLLHSHFDDDDVFYLYLLRYYTRQARDSEASDSPGTITELKLLN
jgi:hypothetical protein